MGATTPPPRIKGRGSQNILQLFPPRNRPLFHQRTALFHQRILPATFLEFLTTSACAWVIPTNSMTGNGNA